MGNFLNVVIVIVVSCLTLPSVASDLFCEQIDRPGVSDAKIIYSENVPVELALRSPGQADYRPQNLVVEVVTAASEHSPWETFIARPPVESTDVDWSQQQNCFVEAGTTLYFLLNRRDNQYSVQLRPYFLKRERECQEPRLPAQTIELQCREGIAL